MPLFTYTALSENGSRITGEGTAATAELLRGELAGRGLLVQEVRPKRSGVGVPSRRRVRPEAFMLFNQEFIALLRAGLTIPETLRLSAERPDSPQLSQVLKEVGEAVRDGALLSEACVRHQELFDGLYLAALKTGEKTGTLAQVLEKYQINLRHRVELARKVGHAPPPQLPSTLAKAAGYLDARRRVATSQ